jgi:DNA-binding transcriptional ArsR family regulator
MHNDDSGSTSALHDHAGVPEHAHQDVARVLHALADPTRLSLVHLLAEDALRVVDLTGALGLAQSTVSAHLATLRAAGLVVATPEGRATRYALADPELDELLGAAERVVARTEGRRWGTTTGAAGTGTAATTTG